MPNVQSVIPVSKKDKKSKLEVFASATDILGSVASGGKMMKDLMAGKAASKLPTDLGAAEKTQKELERRAMKKIAGA